MIRRRSLLASSVAVPLLGQAGVFGGADAGVPDAGIPDARAGDARAVRYFVFDRRLVAAGAKTATTAASAAAAAVAGGAELLAHEADITPVYELLDRKLAEAPFAIAGVTTANAFFVFERLAWDRGLRTAARGSDWRATGFAQMPPSAEGTAPLSWLVVPR